MTLLESLKSRADACFLCKWIREDLVKHGELTDWSPGDGALSLDRSFPKGGKIRHLQVERFSIDNVTKSRILSVD